jgi:Zn-dependent membrane protease YugP
MSPWILLYDATYIFVILGSIVVIMASAYMQSVYRTYSRIPSQRGLTGDDVANMILRYGGVHDVRIQSVAGQLTDHYNPRDKTLNLSQASRQRSSLADLGVAAHECGHALQHNQQYFPLQIRNFLVPITNVGAKLSWPIILVGMLMGFDRNIMNVGIFLFAIVFIFQLVTLPVEFNASARAIKALESYNVLSPQELNGTRKVLRAAALTYVASAAATFLQLFRLILLTNRNNRD